MEIKGTGQTDPGLVRTSNQDAFLVDDQEQLYIVADGMGGHAGGEIASQLCILEVATFLKFKEKEQSRRSTMATEQSQHLVDSINHASTKIYEKALENPTLRGMGTTATVIKIVGDQAFCGHVGDSRLYLLRCGFIYRMTSDHSLVGEQVRAGLITEEEAEEHHLRNVITRSVGYQEEEDVDVTQFKLEENDLLMLTSDGLHGKMSDIELANMTQSLKLSAIQPLVDLAKERGGEDNITIIAIEVK